MKKVSTAAAQESRNLSRQTLTIGLDLGDRNSWVVDRDTLFRDATACGYACTAIFSAKRIEPPASLDCRSATDYHFSQRSMSFPLPFCCSCSCR